MEKKFVQCLQHIFSPRTHPIASEIPFFVSQPSAHTHTHIADKCIKFIWAVHRWRRQFISTTMSAIKWYLLNGWQMTHHTSIHPTIFRHYLFDLHSVAVFLYSSSTWPWCCACACACLYCVSSLHIFFGVCVCVCIFTFIHPIFTLCMSKRIHHNFSFNFNYTYTSSSNIKSAERQQQQ